MSWQVGGHRHKKQRRQKWRDRQARAYVQGLNPRQLAELREAIGAHDEGLPFPEIPAKKSAGQEITEYLQRSGRSFLDRVRGKR